MKNYMPELVKEIESYTTETIINLLKNIKGGGDSVDSVIFELSLDVLMGRLTEEELDRACLEVFEEEKKEGKLIKFPIRQ